MNFKSEEKDVAGKTVTKKQHFVPTMYLQRWGSAYLLDNRKLVSIKSVCQQSYFYSSRDEQLGSGPNLEAFLANYIEGGFAPFLKRILERCETTEVGAPVLSKVDREWLAIWIVSQVFRTPAYQAIAKQHVLNAIQQVEHYTRYFCTQQGMPDPGFCLYDRSDYSDMMKAHMVETLERESGVIQSVLEHGIFFLVKNKTAQGFHTSDNPVWITGADYLEHGVVRLCNGEPFGVMTLPLSPEVILIVNDKRTNEGLEGRAYQMFAIEDCEEVSEVYNKMAILNAHRCVLITGKGQAAKIEEKQVRDWLETASYESSDLGWRLPPHEASPTTVEELMPTAQRIFSRLVDVAKTQEGLQPMLLSAPVRQPHGLSQRPLLRFNLDLD